MIRQSDGLICLAEDILRWDDIQAVVWFCSLLLFRPTEKKKKKATGIPPRSIKIQFGKEKNMHKFTAAEKGGC